MGRPGPEPRPRLAGTRPVGPGCHAPKQALTVPIDEWDAEGRDFRLLWTGMLKGADSSLDSRAGQRLGRVTVAGAGTQFGLSTALLEESGSGSYRQISGP